LGKAYTYLSMKLILSLLLALVVCGASNGYIRLIQTVCNDANCSKVCTSTMIPLGKCEPQSDGTGLMVTCSTDGTSFNETMFTDMKCSKETNTIPGVTKTCYKAALLEFVKFSCSQ